MVHQPYTLMEYRWVEIKEIQMNKRQKIKLLRNNPQGFFCRYGKDQTISLACWCALNRGISGELLFNQIEVLLFFEDESWKYGLLKAHEAELSQSQQGLLRYVKSKFMSWLPE